MLTELTPIIRRLVDGKDLTADETEKVASVTAVEDTEGYYNLAFTAGILAKGLTEDELYGLVRSLQGFSVQVDLNIDPRIVTDVSGSGGDKLRTFNISTAAAFVVAGAGVPVAKQAFRSFTSPLGASDVVQELGVKLSQSEREMVQCLEAVGIVQLFYPYLYRGMDARLSAYAKLREIGLILPTPFHPIAFVPHPFGPKRRIYGLAWEEYLQPVASIFRKLGYERVMVFHGLDGLDEISNIGPTKILELDHGSIEEYVITPEELGIRRASYEDIESGDKAENVRTLLRVLYDKESGPKRDIVLMNAAASLYVMEKAGSMKSAVDLAQRVVSEHKAAEKLEELVKFNGHPERLEQWKVEANV